MQQGGGIGYDFSTLRPKGAPVKGVGADASGPLSFMDVWDAMCRTIMSAGYRRGAMMATLRCDHPDIEAFIDAKREPGRLRMFNLSVLVTDAFMTAVKEDAPWELGFGGTAYQGAARARAVGPDHARDLRLCRAGRDLHRPHQPPQQPALLRDHQRDQSVRRAAAAALRRLPAGLDQSRGLVREPFTAKAAARPRRAGARWCRVAVRMLDNVIDVSRFPLPQQAQEAKAKRRIGLGVTGLADALILCGVRYGSARGGGADRGLAEGDPARGLSRLGRARRREGRLPALRREKPISPARRSRGLDEDVRAAIARPRHPQRAADLDRADRHDLAAGRQRLLGHRAGVQLPLHAQRADARRHAAARRRSPTTPIACSAASRARRAPLPEDFVDAQTLAPADHVVMQAAVQKYVDSSISKTINVPADIPFEQFKDVYLQAYELGCKGCTTYRPNEVTGAVLEVKRGQRRPRRAAARSCRCRRRGRKAQGHLRGRRRRLHDPAARPARGAAGQHLQDHWPRERARDLHHHQRHHPGRPPPAVRDLHQLEEHGALRLDGRR